MAISSGEFAGTLYPNEENPHLSIIIPVRDDADRLERCLASLLADARPEDRIEIIIGDNESRDHCAKVAESANAKVIRLDGMSVAGVRNGAARQAQGTLLAFIDSDHTVSPGWISAAFHTFRDAQVGAAGAPCWAPRPGTWVQQAYDRFRNHPTKTDEAEWIGSGNLFVRRDVFLNLGGFDDSLEACEDVDLCFRIRKAGYRILANPAIKNTHWGDPTTLCALFRGELWRGRNNLKVSLRKPFNLRAVASAAISLIILASVSASICALIIEPQLWKWWLFLAVFPLSMAIMLRFGKMTASSHQWDLGAILANIAVAGMYEAARALAILLHAGHHRRSQRDFAQ
jgi:GT2 family glycosyltransferase